MDIDDGYRAHVKQEEEDSEADEDGEDPGEQPMIDPTLVIGDVVHNVTTLEQRPDLAKYFNVGVH